MVKIMNPRSLKTWNEPTSDGAYGNKFGTIRKTQQESNMSTVVKNWQIVSIMDNGEVIGRVLWGICVEDMTARFNEGDYICTSKIVQIDPSAKLITTFRGNSYKAEGDGKEAEVQVEDFELLRQGFNPEEINRLRSVTIGLLN